MPRKARVLGHVQRIARPHPQQKIPPTIKRLPLLVRHLAHVVGRNHEQRVAPDADADQPLVRLLGHVPVHHHGVAGRVDVDDGGLRLRLGEQGLEEAGHVRGEARRLRARVDAVRPVVLAAEGDPVELAFEDLLDGEGFVDLGVLGFEPDG